MAGSGGGGCCPSMDLMRSEAMQLVHVIIPAESAHLTVSYLGDLGLVQFKDVEELSEVSNKAALLKLFLENENELDLSLRTAKSKSSLATFFELYVPGKEENWFVGAFLVKDSMKLSEILTKINQMGPRLSFTACMGRTKSSMAARRRTTSANVISGSLLDPTPETVAELMVGGPEQSDTRLSPVGETTKLVEELWEASNKAHSALLKLLPENEYELDLSVRTAKSKSRLATFFELYIPGKEENWFVGAFFVKDSQKLSEILTKINQMAGYRSHEQIYGFLARRKLKYGHESNCSDRHPSLLLCKDFYCTSNSSSNSLDFAPINSCTAGWIMILRNIALHPRNLSSLEDIENALPPMKIVAGRFEDLPQEILMDIFALLEFSDLVRVGSVCSSWNSAYSSICSFGQFKCSDTPCLIYTSESAGENVVFLYSLMEKRACKLTLPEPAIQRRYLIGSSHGWLITADEHSEMHLVNPITSEQISLPSVITIEQVTPILDESGVICSYRFSRHTAEANMGPSSTHSLCELRDYLFHKAHLFYDTSVGNYFVVLIHNPFGQLSFARLGDEKWTWLPPYSLFDDCIYKDGLLYAVTLCGTVITFDISRTEVTTKIILDLEGTYTSERVYIVQAPWGDLLQIRRPEVWIRDSPNKKATFENVRWVIRIYKVCIASRKLVQINCLDDHVLFLGHNQSLCSRAEEYPHLKPNHIYFTDDCKSASVKCRSGFRLIIGTFNLQSMEMGEIVSPRMWSKCVSPLWILPNPRKME